MRIRILETDKRLGVKKGEIYKARRYHYDPQEKVTLLGREPDGYDPECNQYINEVAFWIDNQWMCVVDGQYIKEEEDD